MSIDDTEILSYQLCHVYSRSLNNASTSAPTYYAHHSHLKTCQCLDQLLQRYNLYIMFYLFVTVIVLVSQNYIKLVLLSGL